MNPVFYTAVSGLIAAIIGWGVIEFFSKSEDDILMYALLTVVSMGLGCFISAIDSLMSGNIGKTFRNGSIGLGYGFLIGTLCCEEFLSGVH